MEKRVESLIAPSYMMNFEQNLLVGYAGMYLGPFQPLSFQDVI